MQSLFPNYLLCSGINQLSVALHTDGALCEKTTLSRYNCGCKTKCHFHLSK